MKLEIDHKPSKSHIHSLLTFDCHLPVLPVPIGSMSHFYFCPPTLDIFCCYDSADWFPPSSVLALLRWIAYVSVYNLLETVLLSNMTNPNAANIQSQKAFRPWFCSSTSTSQGRFVQAKRKCSLTKQRAKNTNSLFPQVKNCCIWPHPIALTSSFSKNIETVVWDHLKIYISMTQWFIHWPPIWIPPASFCGHLLSIILQLWSNALDKHGETNALHWTFQEQPKESDRFCCQNSPCSGIIRPSYQRCHVSSARTSCSLRVLASISVVPCLYQGIILTPHILHSVYE